MFFDLRKGLFATILMVVALAGAGFGQVAKQGEGSDLQRLDVMREKLDRMREPDQFQPSQSDIFLPQT